MKKETILSVLKEIRDLLKEQGKPIITGSDKLESSVLKMLSVDKLTIPKTGGERYIDKAEEFFSSCIDSDFQNWNLNKPGKATGETVVQAYELNKDATFTEMFTSLSTDLDKLCLTQSQIISFCEKYSDNFFKDSNSLFFLFSDGEGKNKKYFVASVYAFSAGLFAYVYHFESDNLWYAEFCHRVVVPQF